MPGDRWLVLTDVAASGSATIGTPQFGIPAGLTEAASATNAFEVETGLQTPYHSSGAVGLTFKPGTRVPIALDAGAPPKRNKTTVQQKRPAHRRPFFLVNESSNSSSGGRDQSRPAR